VAAASCEAANAATTAAIVLGEAAPAWLRAAGYPARLVAADGSVLRLGGWPDPRGGPRRRAPAPAMAQETAHRAQGA
jgi:thiamine biosynthesis lipoprotein